jgi:hypothetical protein
MKAKNHASVVSRSLEVGLVCLRIQTESFAVPTSSLFAGSAVVLAERA